MAISKLVDIDPSSIIDTSLGKITGKTMKAMHMVEVMHPRRSEDIRNTELSDSIRKIRDEREKAVNPDHVPAIEEEKVDDKKSSGTDITEEEKE